MNAVELLKADHDTVEELFKQFKQNEDGRHASLFKKIKAELDTHTHIEEAVFYPKLMKGGDKELKNIVREGIEEHRQVKMFLKELSAMAATNKQFNAKLKVVVEDVEHHVKEEEKEMFPMVEDQFSERVLQNLGTAMQKEKARYQQAHGIKPAKPIVKKGTIETVIDKVKDAVSGIVGGGKTPAKKASPGRGRVKRSAPEPKPKRTKKAVAKVTAKRKPALKVKAAARS